MLNDLVKSAHAQAGRLQVRSALNPILWLIGIVFPLTLFGAWLFQNNPVAVVVCLAVGVLPVVTACFVYVGFAIWRPEKLQSEDYQIRNQALHILQRGNPNAVRVSSVTAIANPLFHAEEGERGPNKEGETP